MSRSSLPPTPTPTPAERRRTTTRQKNSPVWERQEIDASDQVMDEAIDPDELREFVAADMFECKDDPIFKERLRERLWRIVRKRKPKP